MPRHIFISTGQFKQQNIILNRLYIIFKKAFTGNLEPWHRYPMGKLNTIEQKLKKKMTGKERRILLQYLYIDLGLKQCNGSRRAAAEWLGFSGRGLRKIINEKYTEFNEKYPRPDIYKPGDKFMK